MALSEVEQVENISRRVCLRAGGVSAFGLGLPQLLGSRNALGAGSSAATAKSCISVRATRSDG